MMENNGLSDVQAGKTQETEIVRDGKGRFLKGFSGNVHGSTGARTAKQNMDRAIENWASQNGKTLEEATVDLAWKLAKKGNTSLLQKILDKRMANMNEIEVSQRPIVQMPSIVRNGVPKDFNVGSPVKEIQVHDEFGSGAEGA